MAAEDEARELSATSQNRLTTAFERYLRQPPHALALMLSGTWGSGKTQLFKDVLALEAARQNFKVLYVSVGGISEASSFDDQLFLAAYPLLKTGAAQAVGALLRTGLRNVGIDFKELLKVEAAIGSTTLICIDDFERAEIPARRQILARASDAIELKGAKVLIICDESRLSSDGDYQARKEKVVGRTIRYEPTFAETASLAVKVLPLRQSDAPNSEARAQMKAALEKALIAFECRNLRLTLGGLRCFSEITGNIPPSVLPELEKGFPSLLFTVAALWIQFHQDPRSWQEIASFFQNSEPQFFELYASSDQSSGQAAAFIEKLLQNTPDYSVFSSELVRFVERGSCSEDLLIQQLATSFKSGAESEPIRLLAQFRKLPQTDFDKAMRRALDEIKSDRHRDLDSLFSAASTLLYLSDRTLTPLSSQEVFDLVLEASERLLLRVQTGDIEPKRFNAEFTFNGSNRPPHLSRLLENFNLINQKIDGYIWNRNRRRLFDTLGTDERAFLSALNDQSVQRASLFTGDEDVSRFLEALSRPVHGNAADPSPHLFAVSNALLRHYRPMDMETVKKSDAPHLINLANGVDQMIKDVPERNSLAIAALQELSRGLKALAAPTAR